MSIFNHKDYKDFLNEVYFLKKKKRPSYSFRQFSNDMGFKGAAYIKLLIEEKHSLSDKGVEKISKALNLNENETKYFLLLAEKSKCKSFERRQEICLELDQIAGTNSRGKKIDHSIFFTNRMCGIIIFLIDIYQEKFVPEPLWVSQKTLIKCDLGQIREALNFLIQSKYIIKVQNTYEIMYENFYSSDEIENKYLKHAHTLFLNEAISSLSLPVSNREFANVTLITGKKNFNEIKSYVKKFRDEFKQKVNLLNEKDTSKDSKKICISLNLQMYPLTK